MSNFLSLNQEILPKIYRQNCKIRAQTDVEAVQRFLDEYFEKPTTFRSYKKEVDRFLVWCLKQKRTSLGALNRSDVEEYIEFLKDPKPKDIWCNTAKKDWKPFRGPLSQSAIKTSLTILNSMMGYLAQANYIDFNPFSLIRRKNNFSKSFSERAITVQERILTQKEWEIFIQSLNEVEEENNIDKYKKERLKFLVYTLYFLGLRIDELSRSNWNSFQKINDKWWFFVKGKGDRLGKIPVNSSYLALLMKYRNFLNLSPLPTGKEEGFLIASINSGSGLSVRQMSNLLKELALKTSIKFPKDSLSYLKFKKFSPHWLRHLSASMQDLAGISFTNIKSNLRHQNEQTTRQYIHSDDEKRHKEMEKLTF